MNSYSYYITVSLLGSFFLILFLLFSASYFDFLPHPYNKVYMDCIGSPPAAPLLKSWLAKPVAQSCTQEQLFLLGTDPAGRDILSRMIKSVESYFLPALLSIFLSLVGGLLIGIGKGYPNRLKIKEFCHWISEVIDSIPGFIVVLFVIALFKPSIFVIMAVVGVMNIPKFSSQIAERIIELKKQEFVLALKSFGASWQRIVFYHMIYLHSVPLLLFQVALGMVQAIIYETTLSYLGIGVQEPLPSLGNMVALGKDYFFQGKYWISTLPALAISFNVLLLYFLARLIERNVRRVE